MKIIYVIFILLFYVAPIYRWLELNDGVKTQKEIEDLFFVPVVSLYHKIAEFILLVLMVPWLLLQLLAVVLPVALPFIVLKKYFEKKRYNKNK